MSQSVRQSELFAGQDWQVLYRAFTEINFNASDPPSINRALREYIQTNYAEDFSDWIESSEFVAIIDLLAWLAGTLAFKTDINARENFLETAEARESILRLARFLSYNPRRNQPARGLLKLTEIETNEDVFDAFGNNLAGRTISWNDPDDPDWFERFVLILNSAFVSTNPFGIPLKSGTVADVRTQLYRLNSRFGDADLGFNVQVSGENMPFEIINTDFEDDLGFVERTPDLDAALHMVYRSDGNGNGSARTGFFMGFKQGQLQRRAFNITTPIENQTIDIDVENINQSDVWVQTINDLGEVLINWEKVPAIFSDNITFNSITPDVRNIFQAVTRDNDQVTIRFADGRFGAAPIGNIRVWFRTSNGLQYQIRPKEMERITTEVSFFNRRGVRKTLTLTFTLEESVSNSAPRETEEQIRRRAPQVYATQNRMVSGEDYNTFPMQSNLATKIKAVTRVYSGHSRFIDLNDPTGNYQDTNVFSDDGIFYKERTSSFAEIALSDNRTPEEMVAMFIQPVLKTSDMFNYVYDYLLNEVRNNKVLLPGIMLWNRVTDSRYSSTGWFSLGSQYLKAGATILFQEGLKSKWVSIADIYLTGTFPPDTGEPGPVILAEPVITGAEVKAIIPRFASSLPEDVVAAIKDKIERTLSFTLWYDYAPNDGVGHWSVRDPSNIDTLPITAGTAIKLMSVEYLAGSVWRFTAPGLRYVFESQNNVQFYFDGSKTVDQETLLQKQDLIRVLRVNEDMISSGPLARDYDLAIDRMIYYPDGYGDPTRVIVKFRDRDEDGYPDDPDTYFKLVSDQNKDTYLFWKRKDDGMYAPVSDVVVFESEADRLTSDLDKGTVIFQITGDKPNTFWQLGELGWTNVTRQYRYANGRGPNTGARWFTYGGLELDTPRPSNIMFQWKHYAPSDHRIDPAKTNVIDAFVLTSEYDYLTRQWIANGADLSEIPAAPTELELRSSFAEFEQYKMFSDEIVWRPVRYKYLFGNGAEQQLKATFKVVKLPSTSMSDGEIKSRVVRAIGEYFSADYWDFGETFYYTELAAYIHQQLASVIASCVIVPQSDNGVFGEVFEVKCRSDEIFISTATVANVTIIDSNTYVNLRIN